MPATRGIHFATSTSALPEQVLGLEGYIPHRKRLVNADGQEAQPYGVIMQAGKWIAKDRGSEEIEPVAQIPVPTYFPLSERLSLIDLVLLYSFRDSLPDSREHKR